MAGIAEVIAAVERAIAGVVPRTGAARFRPKPLNDSVAPYDWLRVPTRAHRDFAVAPATLEVTSACWLTAELEVGVVYRAEMAQSDVVPFEDGGRIVAVLRDPANASANTVSVTPTIADKLETVDIDGRPATRLFLLAVRVEYYETPAP